MNAKVKSGIATAVIVLLAMLLMSLNIFAYTPPDPPIPEEGVEVNLGDSDFGQGDSPEPASEAANYAPPASQQQVVTQRTEPTVPVPSSPNPGNITNPAAQQQPVVENKEPEINKNALFPGKRNQQSNGGNEGNTQGQGNQGKPDGNPNSDNYSGNGGGNGVSFSLKGRSAVALPNPKTYRGNDQGKVVVKVWVDQQGNVIRTEAPQKGSTLTKQQYVSMAVEYAKKAKFSPSKDAPEEQVGTITYIFKI
jgi:TonB family protein